MSRMLSPGHDEASIRLSRLNPPWQRWPRASGAILITLTAFAARSFFFGDPLVHWDEQFYLLVGDRMLHGALPFVDIWDRKPIGLFLIYAAIRLLGGSGIIQYQIVATLFAAATGIVIARIAQLITTVRASTVAGILYVLMISLAGGMGGQSPVFYNLFVAMAALLVIQLECAAVAVRSARIRAHGSLAMLLVGVAMQIKYNALFEGIFFGIILAHRSWRTTRSAQSTCADMALFVASALLPTAAALGVYWALGHAREFVFANFLSIGARVPPDPIVAANRLFHTARTIAAPLVCLILAAALKPWRAHPQGPRAFGLVMAWFGAALFGYLIFGTYFNHYILPVMVPLAIGAAPVFSVRHKHLGVILAALMLVAGGAADTIVAERHIRHWGGKASADAIMAAITPNLTGCLYLYDGLSIPYYLSRACIPTRFAFPQHLNQIREAGAIGADQLAEIRRIMATRPSVVVDMVEQDESEERPAANALFRSYLPRHYEEVARVPMRKAVTIVYRRID